MVPVAVAATAIVVVVLLLLIVVLRRRDTTSVDRAVAHHDHALAAIAQSSRRSGSARVLPQRDSGAPTIESKPGPPPADENDGANDGADAEVVDLRGEGVRHRSR